jgi:DNA replication protein DnaC
MDDNTKHQILARINSFQSTELLPLIKQGDIPLLDMKLAGLQNSKVNELTNLIETAEKDERIQRQKTADAAEKQRIKDVHFSNIANRHPDYDENKIRQLLEEGAFTVENLVWELEFTHEDIEKIVNPVQMDTGFPDWKDLPDLPEGRTDIYVFGIVGSGKSTMLAGILHQAQKAGMIEADPNYRVGVHYKDELIRRIKLGILPNGTMADVLNFIPIILYDKDEIGHPLSFIEMSGENFTRTYNSGKVNDPDSIGARTYLNNNNRKILMFVIDYRHHKFGHDIREIATQDAQLQNVLMLLSNDGTLDKTDALMIVVTKADLFSKSISLNDAVHQFLISSDYLNFFNTCKRLKEKHKFRLILHPFSLGTFKLPKIYDFNPLFSDNLLSDLISFSFRKKKTWFERIFK